MRRLFEETLVRPLGAFLSGVELLGRRVDAARMFDGVMSRMVHNLSSPHGGRREARPGPRPPAPEDGGGAARGDARGRRPLE